MRKTHPMNGLVWLLVVGFVLMPLHPLWAQAKGVATTTEEAAALLKEGVRLYDELEWDTAIEKLKAAIDAGLSRPDRAQAYWYLANLARARDDMEAAENYLYEVLRANPAFELPETLRGTDFEPLFGAAVARMDRNPPAIRILPLKGVAKNRPVTVAVVISDESKIERVELAFELPNATTETIVRMTPKGEGRWEGMIPATALTEGRLLAYKVRAADEWQNVGTQSATISVPKGGGGGFFLYALIGSLVAIGGGIAAYLSGALDQGGTPTNGNGNGTTEVWPQSSAPLPPQ